MGHPTRILSEAEKAEVETLAAVLSSEQIADYLGMGRRTFYSLMQGDEDIAARYKRGRARAVGAVAQSLIAKARAGNITAMIFFLKTQGGWRETDRLELSGSEGGAIRLAVEDTTEADAAEFLARVQRLMEVTAPQSEARAEVDGILQLVDWMPPSKRGQDDTAQG